MWHPEAEAETLMFAHLQLISFTYPLSISSSFNLLFGPCLAPCCCLNHDQFVLAQALQLKRLSPKHYETFATAGPADHHIIKP